MRLIDEDEFDVSDLLQKIDAANADINLLVETLKEAKQQFSNCILPSYGFVTVNKISDVLKKFESPQGVRQALNTNDNKEAL